MTNSFIDLSNKCDQVATEIISCLKVLDEKTRQLHIDFFVVGAQARILILEQYYGFTVKTIAISPATALTGLLPDFPEPAGA
jgi:hypothetical protein